MLKSNIQHDFRRLLEFSVAAHRLQGYIKANVGIVDNVYPNKTLVYANVVRDNPILMVEYEKLSSYFRPFYIETAPKLVITPADKVEAEKIIDYFSNEYTIAKLSDELDGFGETVDKMILSQKVEDRNIGFIVCLPNSYYQTIKMNATRNFYKSHADNPQGHFGARREQVNVVATVIDVCFFKKPVYSKEQSTWMVVLETDCKKIVKIYNSNEYTVQPFNKRIGKKVRISATVKGHYKNNLYGSQETTIHKVKSVEFI